MSGKKTIIKTSADLFNCVIVVVIILFIRSSVLGNYKIPTGSMNPTIKEGDRIFSSKLSYGLKLPFFGKYLFIWEKPSRGDVIVFQYPGNKSREYTKRVIGLPGDIVQLKNKSLYINGEKVKKHYLGKNNSRMMFQENLMGIKYNVQFSSKATVYDTMPKTTVPKNCFFVLGDNRDNSSDSRDWGFVPFNNVNGQLGFRWISIDPENKIPGFRSTGFLR